jgi:SAM-dependent methyltransferase
VHFDCGYGDALPYGNGIFTHVFSSLMLHHIEAATQPRLLAEVRRVLAPGGCLHLMDFVSSERPSHRGWFGRMHFGGLRPHLQPEEELVAKLRRAGFSDVRAQRRDRLLSMPVLSYLAVTPPRVQEGEG